MLGVGVCLGFFATLVKPTLDCYCILIFLKFEEMKFEQLH